MHFRSVTVVAVALVAALGSTGASASAGGSGATVKTRERVTFKVNQYIQDGLRYLPGTVRVASGSTLTFAYADREDEPHTLTIVAMAQLPRTIAQIENCRACQQLATPHLKNPKAPPGDKNPIVHWTLDKGQQGLDTIGDSLAIQPGAHKQNSAVVSAPSGTTLYFLCAIHPWMQGKIIVS